MGLLFWACIVTRQHSRNGQRGASMYLGIEIGGTKLQVGLGRGDGRLVQLVRSEVDGRRGAEGILEEIARLTDALLAEHAAESIGVGFGGPVDLARGVTLKSHHVEGWDDFPLAAWCTQRWGRPAVIGNDADVAALAEATLGAGRGYDPVFYVTVGTGIGGGLVHGGRIYRGAGQGAAELGHLRPGLHADRPEQNLESLAAGWGIAATVQARVSGAVSRRIGPLVEPGRAWGASEVRRRLIAAAETESRDAADLLERCGGDLGALSTKIVGAAAVAGNRLAQQVLDEAWQALGWGLAQVVTLLAPAAIVIGGGVSLLGETHFFAPLRKHVERYVFPPFRESFRLLPAGLGEEVVIHGAIALASQAALPA